MKLRLRSLESKETHKIEVPNSCNLQHLKETITLQLLPSSSLGLQQQQSFLLLSLNRKEELCGSSPQDSLQSLGLTSGDLIYFTRNPNAFSSQIPNLSQVQFENSKETSTCDEQVVDLINTQKVDSGKFDELNAVSAENNDLIGAHIDGTLKLSNPSVCASNLGNTMMIESRKGEELIGSSVITRDLMDSQVDGSSNSSDCNEGKSVELVEGNDEMDVDGEADFQGNDKFSVPSFLKKVFVKEVGDSAVIDGDHKLLVIAVHAVLLESGFVGYNPVSGMKIDGFHLSEEWPSTAFGMTLHYTLPEVSTSEVVETVVLKFQTLGKFVKIYGLLPKYGFLVHQVCLDELRFLPTLRFIWQKSDYQIVSYNEMDVSGKWFPNQEIFEFWKIVKDGLSYPLLIDLCERAGLVPPPCFMRLPTELKLKILESLPAVDVARVEGVCSELRFIASNNDLWKLKYVEEFGNATFSQNECQWKAKFTSAWEIRKKRKRICSSFPLREQFIRLGPLFPGRRDRNSFGSPFIIGGDYDRLPGLGLPQYPGRRIFRSNCDLGGFGL